MEDLETPSEGRLMMMLQRQYSGNSGHPSTTSPSTTTNAIDAPGANPTTIASSSSRKQSQQPEGGGESLKGAALPLPGADPTAAHTLNTALMSSSFAAVSQNQPPIVPSLPPSLSAAAPGGGVGDGPTLPSMPGGGGTATSGEDGLLVSGSLQGLGR